MRAFGVVAARVLQAIPTLLIVGTIVFLTMRVIPGDPAQAVLGENATAEQLAAFRAANGLDQPLLLQYFSWLGNIAGGDFGRSYVLGEPVTDLILTNAAPTVLNAVLALVIVTAIGIPIGVYSATRAGTLPDRVVIGASAVTGTIPGFLISLLLIAVFAVGLRLLPSGGYPSLKLGLGAALPYMILPSLALALTQIGYMVRIARTSVVEELSQSYILSQRARGYGNARAVSRALRNAAIPLLTVAGQSLGQMIAGAVIIETVFTIPGLGHLTITALTRGDFALLAGVVMFISVFVILVNLVVDISYSLLDPRVRKGS